MWNSLVPEARVPVYWYSRSKESAPHVNDRRIREYGLLRDSWRGLASPLEFRDRRNEMSYLFPNLSMDSINSYHLDRLRGKSKTYRASVQMRVI